MAWAFGRRVAHKLLHLSKKKAQTGKLSSKEGGKTDAQHPVTKKKPLRRWFLLFSFFLGRCGEKEISFACFLREREASSSSAPLSVQKVFFFFYFSSSVSARRVLLSALRKKGRRWGIGHCRPFLFLPRSLHAPSSNWRRRERGRGRR